MNVLLQKHGAKHIYKVPEGLRELCADIAREVLRSQPRNIYCFIADYVEALLITRENAEVAVKVVNNILLGSQAIVGVLHRSGLSLEQIVRAAPRIQKAFRAYLDAVDMRAAQVCDDATCEGKSEVSLRDILRETGVPLEQAEESATIIQAAFRGHYERMLLNESRGMIQWRRGKTLEILRKIGASQAEASKAAVLIQATYRGYYARRNLRLKMMAERSQEEKKDEVDIIEPRESVQTIASLDAMPEKSGLMRANEAASVIQKVYRQYRQRKSAYNVSESTVVEAIPQTLHHNVSDEVMTHADIPTEFDNREDSVETGKKLQRAFQDRLMTTRMTEEGGDSHLHLQRYDEEKLARVEATNESPAKLVDDVAEEQEEDPKIDVESKGDEETDAYVRD